MRDSLQVADCGSVIVIGVKLLRRNKGNWHWEELLRTIDTTSGKLLWDRTIVRHGDGVPTGPGNVKVAGFGNIVAHTDGSSLVARDVKSWRMLSRKQLDPLQASDRNSLFARAGHFLLANNRILATQLTRYDAKTGNPLELKKSNRQFIVASGVGETLVPSNKAQHLLVRTKEKTVVSFDLKTGKVVWECTFPNQIVSLTATDIRLYAMSATGALHAVRIPTCKPEWRHQFGSASPIAVIPQKRGTPTVVSWAATGNIVAFDSSAMPKPRSVDVVGTVTIFEGNKKNPATTASLSVRIDSTTVAVSPTGSFRKRLSAAGVITITVTGAYRKGKGFFDQYTCGHRPILVDTDAMAARYPVDITIHCTPPPPD